MELKEQVFEEAFGKPGQYKSAYSLIYVNKFVND